MKKMIFHYPGVIVESGNSASRIRPRKMLESFECLGYEVALVVGYGKERKQSIFTIKERIKKGEKFDFVYSESLTQPTLLSEKNHLPAYPFLDFDFFEYCKKQGINTGLFYRDIYWRFNDLYESKSLFHALVAKFFYYYDLIKYRDLHTIFLPSTEMARYIPIIDRSVCRELPPGTDNQLKLNSDRARNDKQIKLLYVGGFSSGYPMDAMFEALHLTPFVEFTICTREDEWLAYAKKNKIPDNVKIVHESGDGLKEIFENTDLCSLFLEPQEWRKFAFPYKFFEYISYGIPIISIKETPPSRMINEFELGWAINYSSGDLVKLFGMLNDNINLISKYKRNVIKVRDDFTWISRAEKVVSTLLQ